MVPIISNKHPINEIRNDTRVVYSATQNISMRSAMMLESSIVQLKTSLSFKASWCIAKVEFHLVMISRQGGSRSPCSYIDLEYFLNIALQSLLEHMDNKVFLNFVGR